MKARLENFYAEEENGHMVKDGQAEEFNPVVAYNNNNYEDIFDLRHGHQHEQHALFLCRNVHFFAQITSDCQTNQLNQSNFLKFFIDQQFRNEIQRNYRNELWLFLR